MRLRYQFDKADWTRFQQTVTATIALRHARALRLIRHTPPRAQCERIIDAAAAHLGEVLLSAARPLPKSVRQPGVPPYWNSTCQIADEACSAAYAQYETQPTDFYWSAYSQARRQRAHSSRATTAPV